MITEVLTCGLVIVFHRYSTSFLDCVCGRIYGGIAKVKKMIEYKEVGHDLVAEHSLEGNECGLLLIWIVHGYLVVTTVCIQEAHSCMT